MNEDKNLQCANCRQMFVWTIGEQEFMQSLKEDGKLDRVDERTGEKVAGQITTPKRCQNCRTKRNLQRPSRH